ncbi:MAG TPA: BBP7 family outer membrane beta-barrel protein [Pirellulaceae bacterium]|nr:BBP7 family outer membrane beta-barrel protein [Pirellulaceae bacterium]
MAARIYLWSTTRAFASCLLAALMFPLNPFPTVDATGAEPGKGKTRPKSARTSSTSTASLAQYINTDSAELRKTKPEPEVALASAVRPMNHARRSVGGALAEPVAPRTAVRSMNDARRLVGEETVYVHEPGKSLASGSYSRSAPCGQLCFNGFWVRGEYLHWWTDIMDTPTLVTTSPAGTASNIAGVLGQPGTQTLLGNGDLGGSGHSGARITLGWWLDPSGCRGVEANYFGLGRQTSTFSANSANTPILARPMFDTGSSTEAAMLVAHPDLLTGAINVAASTALQGAEALYRRRVFESCDSKVDFLFGYRFARLDESLSITHSSVWTAAQGQIVIGTTQNLFDRFETDNQFHGGELGIAYTQQLNCWSLDTTMKLGLGNNHSEVLINGQTINTVPNGGSATFVGGLLAQQTNIGRFERDAFGFIPELAVTVRRELPCNLHFSLGYSLMYWTATLRPGDQIDRQVSQFPPEAPAGTQQPAFSFHSRGFLAQGLQLGLEYQF